MAERVASQGQVPPDICTSTNSNILHDKMVDEFHCFFVNHDYNWLRLWPIENAEYLRLFISSLRRL